MAFKINFDISDGNLKSLEGTIQRIADKSTEAAKHLQAMGVVLQKASSSQKELKDSAEKSAKGQRDALKSVVEQIKDLSGANGKAAQDISVQYATATKTLNTMKQAVKSASAEAVEGAKRGAKEFGDQSLAIQRAKEKVEKYAIELNKAGAETAKLKAWQDGLKAQRALKKATEDAEKYTDKLNKAGAETAKLKAWQDGLKAQRALEKAAEEAKNYRLELNKVGTAASELKRWQDGLKSQRALKQSIEDAKKYAEKLNKAGHEAAQLKRWQDGLAAGRSSGGISGSTALGAIQPSKVKAAAAATTSLSNSAKRAALEAAAMRAALNAAGTHMGIFTGQTILTAAAVFSLVSALKGMGSIGIQFTEQMARAIPIMGASSAQAAMLEQEVRRLGETTKFTAVEAAGGLTALGMAGLSSAQALEALAPALHLASIGQVDMYKSADILTNVMNGFRLKAEDVPSIVDDLATAVTSSNATIEQMAGALSYVAPVATAAGASIEEVTAILEVFHNAGIKGSRAGTSLRRAYSNLMKPSAAAAQTLSELGIHTKDANGYMLEMSDIMNQLANNGAIAADVIELFGVRAAPAMLALLQGMKGVTSEFAVFRANLEANEGAAKSLAERMEEHLGADLKKLFSALSEQALKFYDHVEDGLRSTTQAMTEFVRSFSAEDLKDFAKTMQWVGEVALATGTAIVALKAAEALLVGVVTAATLAVKAYGIVQAATTVTTTALTAATAQSTVAVAASAGAIKTLGIALKVAFPAMAVVTAAAWLAYEAYSWYSDGATSAADSIKKLSEEEKKYAALQDAAQKRAERGRKYVLQDGVTGSDKVADKLTSRIAELRAQQAEVQATIDIVIADVTAFGPKQFEGGADAASKQLALHKQEYADFGEQIKKLQGQLDTYNQTGIDEQGIRILERAGESLKKLSGLTFNKESASILKELGTELKNLKGLEGTDQISAAEMFLGAQETIETSAEALKKAYDTKIAPIEARMVKFSPMLRGEDADTGKFIKAVEAKVKVTAEFMAAQETLAQKTNDVSIGFSKFVAEGAKLNTTAESGIATLQSQIDKTKGIAVATKTATQIKLEARQAEILLNIQMLEGKGQEARIEQLKAQYAETTALIEKTKELRDELAQAKTDKKIKDDFASGKGLAADDQAQMKRDARIAELDQYIELGLLKSEEDERYKNAKLEADQELLESQNELWYSAAESMSKSVGDNIAKAAMLDQSWHKTTQNIKKALIGGVIGTLVQVGVKMVATALLNKVLGAEEMALETTKAAVKVGAEGTKAAAVTATATTEQIAATASTAGILSTLVPAATLVTAAWTPAAMMVSLATFGANAAPAMAGMAMTAALAATLAVATAAISGGGTALAGGREIGGHVSAGQSYVVGEKGAEIFTPTTSGAITSNADVKRRANGGGGEVHNHYYDQTSNSVNIKALDTQDVKQALAKESDFLHALQTKQQNRRGKRF